MKKTTLPYKTINLSAPLHAALLIENGNYKSEDLQIRIDEKSNAAQLNAITRIKADNKKGTLSIFTKKESPKRAALIKELPAQSPFLLLMETLEETSAQFETELILEERKHLLGTSELQTRFMEVPDFLNQEQKSIMAGFSPWIADVKGDLELTQDCLESILGHPVQLDLMAPLNKNIEGVNVDNWILECTDEIGGTFQKTKPCLYIQIGPIPVDQIDTLLPGRNQRRFLESVLLPQFLPEDWDWKVEILVEEKNKNFLAENANGMAIVGTNCCIE